MKPSLRDSSKMLPESAEDFVKLKADNPDALSFMGCIDCGCGFSLDNTHTRLGWQETQITGFCEDCFDRITGDDEI